MCEKCLYGLFLLVLCMSFLDHIGFPGTVGFFGLHLRGKILLLWLELQ